MPKNQQGAGWYNSLKGFLGKTEWNPPIIKSDDIRNETEGKMIYTGREMVNAMELQGKEWLSKEGRFFPADAFYQQGALEFLKSQKGDIAIKPGTKKYYEAVSTGTLGRIRRKPSPPPVYAANRIKKANTIQSLRDSEMKLDLSEYQRLLADPKTNQRAVEELRELQAIIADTGKIAQAEIEEKLKRTKLFSSGIGLIGTALGAASGLSSVGALAERASNVATGATQQAFKLTESVVDKIGKANVAMAAVGMMAGLQGIKTQQNLNKEAALKLNTDMRKLAAKTAYGVAMKTAGLVLLGVAANLTPAGGAITALAIVTTAAKGAANIYAKKLEKKEMALKMGKQDLLNTIDEMIKNNGTIFYKADNPMFAQGLVLKEKVENILNTKENAEVFDDVMALENSVRAATLLDEMMVNAANTSQNAAFEQELQKLKTMERVNNANLQKSRNRRTKLKRMYNTYKSPMLEKNLKNIIEASKKEPQKPTQLTNTWNSALKTRKNRRR